MIDRIVRLLKTVPAYVEKSIKITIAAVFAILLADFFHLQYAATAGIITILSIQNTKKETLRLALKRGTAFLCALFLSAFCFFCFGFSVGAFAVYLLCFSVLCLRFGWPEAIAMDSVLITHFMAFGSMAAEQVCNEIGLFCIGTGFGILANLHLKKRAAEFSGLAEKVDMEIRGILKRMSIRLLQTDKSDYDDTCFARLSELLKQAEQSAVRNWNNTFFSATLYEIRYIDMREEQAEVLKHIYESIKMVESIPAQAELVAGLIGQIEQEYHKENNVESLLQRLDDLYLIMRKENLPGNREEFEARAVLFYIMKQLEEFLELKRRFMDKQEVSIHST